MNARSCHSKGHVPSSVQNFYTHILRVSGLSHRSAPSLPDLFSKQSPPQMTSWAFFSPSLKYLYHLLEVNVLEGQSKDCLHPSESL